MNEIAPPQKILIDTSTYTINQFCKFDRRYYVEGFDFLSQQNKVLISTGAKNFSSLNLMSFNQGDDCSLKSENHVQINQDYFGEGTTFDPATNKVYQLTYTDNKIIDYSLKGQSLQKDRETDIQNAQTVQSWWGLTSY